MLSQRRADILNLVVDEYIDTAAPVSSRALVDRHNLALSTATIRNELARLEEDGYVTHPYTSAGRVPSNVGYRFYVERLMEEEPIGPAEQRTIEHQFHQAPPGYGDWLRLAASILAAAVGNVAVVARPQQPQPVLRQAQLVELRPGAALIVAVMDDGSVRQRIAAVPEGEGQTRLGERARLLNERCAGCGAEAVRALAHGFADAHDRGLALDVADLIEEHAEDADLHIAGVRSALEQPEFDSTERILDAVQHLEAYHLRGTLRAAGGARDGARILIGDENPDDWLQQWTVVISDFEGPDGATGSVAVLGPTRMRYGRTIPRVRYVSSLMSGLLQEAEPQEAGG